MDFFKKQGIWGGRRWILSQGDAGERMARSGDVQGTSSLATSIASATCTVAATVQESLWKLPPSMPPPPLPWLPQLHPRQHRLLLLLVAVVVRKWVKEDLLLSSSLALPILHLNFSTLVEGNNKLTLFLYVCFSCWSNTLTCFLYLVLTFKPIRFWLRLETGCFEY